VFCKVNFDEDPALPDLGPRYFPAARFLLQRDRMNMQKLGSLLQVERFHTRSSG